MAAVAAALATLLTVLNIVDRVRSFRHHQDRQAAALERIAAAVEALTGKL